MTTDEMLILKEPIGAEQVEGLRNIRILSGPMVQREDESLAGSVVMMPEFDTRRQMWHGPMVGWIWRVVRDATTKDHADLPSWDRLAAGQQVTRGHIQQLRADGLLPQEVPIGK